jgi:hypothetical protein
MLSRLYAKLVTALALLLALSAVAAARDKITATWDKSLDFSKFKTYNWAPHGAVSHPILAADVAGAIEDELNARGLKKVQTNPDLIIQVYGSVDSEETLYSNDPLYMGTGGIPPFDPSMTGPAFVGWYGNTSVVVQKGQMVIDLIDAANKKLAWRSIAMESISSHDPDKLMKEVNNAITQMFKKYPQNSGGR